MEGVEGPISWYSSRGMPSGLRREALRVTRVALVGAVDAEGRERAARMSEAEGPAIVKVVVVVSRRACSPEALSVW